MEETFREPLSKIMQSFFELRSHVSSKPSPEQVKEIEKALRQIAKILEALLDRLET
jgi:hypothetical protein